MGIKENRKKIQRSLVWLSQQEPKKLALRELKIVWSTLNSLIADLEIPDASAATEESPSPAETSPTETQGCNCCKKHKTDVPDLYVIVVGGRYDNPKFHGSLSVSE